MNWKIGFFIALIGWAGTAFYLMNNVNCPPCPKHPDAQVVAEDSIRNCLKETAEITAQEGCEALSAYDKYLKQNIIPISMNKGVPNNAATFLGGQFCVGELNQVVDSLGLANDQTYAMLGVRDTLIEVLIVGMDVNTGNYRYFDFMDPCPNSCPSYRDADGKCPSN